jgi:hypothetical protein
MPACTMFARTELVNTGAKKIAEEKAGLIIFRSKLDPRLCVAVAKKFYSKTQSMENT